MLYNCRSLRCNWEQDRGATGRMLAVAKIHRDIIYRNPVFEKTVKEIKDGHHVSGDVVRFGQRPYFRIANASTSHKVKVAIGHIQRSVQEFFAMAQELATHTHHLRNVEWCVYTAREKLNPDELKMIIPVYFSTTTSFRLVQEWKQDTRDIFKIMFKGDIKMAVLETINEPKYTGEDVDEHEITLPPGTLTIVKKDMCTDIGRYIYTCEFTPMTVEEWWKVMFALPVLTKYHIPGYDQYVERPDAIPAHIMQMMLNGT